MGFSFVTTVSTAIIRVKGHKMTKKEAIAILINEVEAWLPSNADDPEYADIYKAIEVLTNNTIRSN